MALPTRRRRATQSPGQLLNRFFSLADWPFEDVAEDGLLGDDWAPAIDLKESGKQYVVKADIPGVDPEDIDVTLENGILTIRGQRQEERREDKESWHRLERFAGSFSRQFHLPDAAEDGIEAKMNKGVLEIHIPKSEAAAARKIEIKG